MSTNDKNQSIDPSKIRIGIIPAEPESGTTELSLSTECVSAQADNQKDLMRTARKGNALIKHSVRDDAERLAARAVPAEPVIGDFGLRGQLLMVYAAPGSGKTMLMIWLIMRSIQEGRLDPECVVYVNADDNANGVAEKLALLAPLGAHMVVPNYRGFKTAQFVEKLKEMISDGTASGMVVAIDTLKKFTNVMDKARTADFNDVCREFALAGGTIIALGHTTKNANPDGSPKYQGTTDVVEDYDAVYVGLTVEGAAGANERVIELRKIKSRGDTPERLGYAFSTVAGLGYDEKLATLRELDLDELDGRALEATAAADEDVIASIAGYLASGHGHVGMDQMVRAIAKADGFSRNQVRRVLDRYTGPDPSLHKWHFTKAANRKQTYFLLPRPEA